MTADDRAASLYVHLESQKVEFMHFAFRWMNCLWMRKISVKNTIRMWDMYLVSMPHLHRMSVIDRMLPGAAAATFIKAAARDVKAYL
jgi:hypothetical protein